MFLSLLATVGFAQEGVSSAQGAPSGAPFTVSYQGRVTLDGQPFSGTGYFKFAFVNSQGQYVWTNDMPIARSGGTQLNPPSRAVELSVQEGLFNVLLGDVGLGMQPLIPAMFDDSETSLRVWFSSAPGGPFVQLPDRALASVPYALVAEAANTLEGQPATAFAPANHNHWGETWNGTGTGLTLASSNGVGLYGRQGNSTGFGPIGGAGIWGDSVEHPGVWGSSTDAAGVVGVSRHEVGVGGLSSSEDGIGVQGTAPVTGTAGIATNTAGSTRGVYGESSSPAGVGVYGKAKATSGENAGVVGESDSTAGAGVSGYADARSGNTFGVYGRVYSSDGVGVYGTGPGTGVSGFSTGDSGLVYGVRGRSASPDGAGVAGFNVADSGNAYGVFGRTDSVEGVGVYGIANANSGYNVGVYGKAGSPMGKGVYGEGGYFGLHGVGTDPSGESHGVYGTTASTADTSSGVSGVASASSGQTYGVYGRSYSTEGVGVYGYASATSGATYGVYGESDSTEGVGVYGYASAASGATYGVYGESRGSAANASGVYGVADPVDDRAAVNGVWGETRSKGYSSAGVYGYASNPHGGAVAVWARSAGNGPIFRGYGNHYPDVEFEVTNAGDVYADGNFHSGGGDFAEMLPAVQGLEPGDVLVIGPDGQLTRSSTPNQANVAGVYSTDPGFVGGDLDDADNSERVPIAIVGVVPVKVSAENGAIRPGDLLTASATPGHAMKAKPVDVGGVQIYRPGTIIGKALEPLEKGMGVIRVLITLH